MMKIWELDLTAAVEHLKRLVVVAVDDASWTEMSGLGSSGVCWHQVGGDFGWDWKWG